MVSDFKRVRYFRPKLSRLSHDIGMKALSDSLALEISDIAAFRIHVITHYYKYGLRPTLEAFNIRKSTFHEWKRRYEKNGRLVISLVRKKARRSHGRMTQ